MKKYLLIFIPIVMILLAVGAYAWWYNRPVNKTERAMDEKDYQSVVGLYDKLSDTSDRKQVQKKLLNVAGDKYDEYLEGEIGYEEISEYYDLVSEKVLKKNDEMKAYISDVKAIEEARESYKKGLQLIEDKDYIEAMKVFEAISSPDKEIKKKADDKYAIARDSYIKEIDDNVAKLIENEEYEEALGLIDQALLVVSEESTLMSKKEEIEGLITASYANKWYATYNLGALIADELGVKGYDVYFPVKLVFDFADNKLNMYVQKESIKPAIDSLTQDEKSMEAVYSVAEQFGLSRKQADFIIKITYRGSYSDFIMDYFEKDIDKALADFSYNDTCYVSRTKIYLGTSTRNDDHYFIYTENESEMVLSRYEGRDKTLKLLQYPINLSKE